MDALQSRIEELAKAAARADAANGDTRVSQNVMSSLAWALKLRSEHRDCGRITFNRDLLVANREPLYVTCPVHGRIDGPKWVEA